MMGKLDLGLAKCKTKTKILLSKSLEIQRHLKDYKLANLEN